MFTLARHRDLEMVDGAVKLIRVSFTRDVYTGDRQQLYQHQLVLEYPTK